MSAIPPLPDQRHDQTGVVERLKRDLAAMTERAEKAEATAKMALEHVKTLLESSDTESRAWLESEVARKDAERKFAASEKARLAAVEALGPLLRECKEFREQTGGCDHSVGIFCWSLIYAIEQGEKALAAQPKITTPENSRPTAPAPSPETKAAKPPA